MSITSLCWCQISYHFINTCGISSMMFQLLPQSGRKPFIFVVWPKRQENHVGMPVDLNGKKICSYACLTKTARKLHLFAGWPKRQENQVNIAFDQSGQKSMLMCLFDQNGKKTMLLLCLTEMARKPCLCAV